MELGSGLGVGLGVGSGLGLGLGLGLLPHAVGCEDEEEVLRPDRARAHRGR